MDRARRFRRAAYAHAPVCERLAPGAEAEESVEPARELRRRLALEWLPMSYPFGSRLEAQTKRRLFDAGVYDCALGITGFAPVGTPPHRLERAAAERGLRYHVFGHAFAGRPRKPSARLAAT